MSQRLEATGKAYEQVAASLRSRIAAGEFAVGERLPANRELAEEYGVAPNTVLSAYSVLRNEGVLTSQQGRGTFVRAFPADAPTGMTAVIEQMRAEISDLKARVEVLESGHGASVFYPDLPVDPEHQASIQLGMKYGQELARRLAQRKAEHTAAQVERGEHPHPPEDWAEEFASIYQEITGEMQKELGKG